MAIGLVGQARLAEPLDYDEQGRKEHEQIPIHQLEHLVGVALGEHHHQCAAGQRGPGQVQSRHKAHEYQPQHGERQEEQAPVQRGRLRLGALDDRMTEHLAKPHAQHHVLNNQPRECHGRQ